MLTLTTEEFYRNQNWGKALAIPELIPTGKWVELFDQNGYRMTDLEVLYAIRNQQLPIKHRHENTIKKTWIEQEEKLTGAVLNHAALFERKGYEEEALAQLIKWAEKNNTLYKLVRYRGKWGIDFSIDYVDQEGNAMEIFHYEFDGFNLDEITEMKVKLEKIILNTDWEDAAKALLKRKDEWHSLDFFGQSDWKCAFFGLPSERFKMIAWE